VTAHVLFRDVDNRLDRFVVAAGCASHAAEAERRSQPVWGPIARVAKG
jgi:hypothetical protein